MVISHGIWPVSDHVDSGFNALATVYEVMLSVH